MLNSFISFIRDYYNTSEFIPLHAPVFQGNEKDYLIDVVNSTFVSSVGEYVGKFETHIEQITGTSKAVATVNGTAALHAALHLAGVRQGDLVITQALTFVATCNALHHMGAEPLFLDVSRTSLGLCPKAVSNYLEEYAEITEHGTIHKKTKQWIKAVVPMHTFGHPVELDEFIDVCKKWNLSLVEDAAESLGSFYKGRHTGTFGEYGAISFNGNKVITTGGGGIVLCSDKERGVRAKHVTTTAKVPHPYEFFHDEAGFNYRMPNLNAALGCAQLEKLDCYLKEKRALAALYLEFFAGTEYQFVVEPEYARSNYWLNAVICHDEASRRNLLEQSNASGVMTRPVWQLMHTLPMYNQCLRDDLSNSEWLEKRLVNLPSSVKA